MEIFFTLLTKLLPLYAIMGLGFVACRYLKVSRESIATLLIYIIAPIVVFYGVMKADIRLDVLALPFFFLAICSFFCGILWVVSKFFWKDNTRNIFAFTSATANTGYFGLPVALILFQNDVFSLMVFSILGFVLFENTVGFFVIAKGHHTAKEALQKVLTLPTVYAFVLGVALNLLKVPMGDVLTNAFDQFKSSYTVFGMMIIGMGLATATLKSFDLKFLSLSFLAKFVCWPAFMMGFVYLDRNFIHFFRPEIYPVMLLMSILPLPANSVALATKFNVHPEKAATAVFLSTLFALVFIPLMVGILV